MTTIEQVKKHYDKLTAPERFALMVAAGGRGDKAERDALDSSAPKVTFEFPHTMGLTHGFDFLTSWHLIQQLSAAGTFFMLIHWEDNKEPLSFDAMGATHTLDDATLLAARRFLENLYAWREVCKEYKVDGDLLLGMYPNWEALLAMAELTLVAWDKEHHIELTGADECLKSYRHAIEIERERWAEARAK